MTIILLDDNKQSVIIEGKKELPKNFANKVAFGRDEYKYTIFNSPGDWKAYWNDRSIKLIDECGISRHFCYEDDHYFDLLEVIGYKNYFEFDNRSKP